MAPDGVNTTFYAAPGDIPEDHDALPNFFGTSAAASHAAGVAALLQGRARGGAAIVDGKGALRGLRMCFVWKERRFRIPLTFVAAPEQVPDALATDATLGPCWARTPEELERLLETSAVDMSAPGYDLDTGHGLIDARAALRKLFRLPHASLPAP